MADRSVQSPIWQVPRQTQRSGTSQVSSGPTSSDSETAGQTLKNRSVRRNGLPSTDATPFVVSFRRGAGTAPDRRNDGTDHAPALLDHYPSDPNAWFGDPAEIIEAATTDAGNLVARIRASRPAWMRSAACRGMDINIFHPRRGQSSEPAKQVCAGCPVLTECRHWSLDQPDDHGIAAGLSGRQRRQLRAERKRGAA